jgi:trafficking protein particle complex subunit 9
MQNNKAKSISQAQAIQALPTIRSPAEPTSSPPVSSEQTQEVKRPASVGPLQRTPSSSSIKINNRNSVVASQNSSTENLAEKRGSSKGRGRVLKVLGDIHLLCGLLPSAVTSYTQAVEILRLTTDYIWHASALEGVAMALILLRFLNVDFSVRTPVVDNSNCHPRSLLFYSLRSHSPPRKSNPESL